jgi:hydrogenase nickel incorporation protein HypA/HybF
VHELALMESVVDAIIDHVDRESRVAVVRLEIGELAGVDVAALRFCFDVCTQATAIAGAELDIITVDARARCRVCHTAHHVRSLASACPCGSYDRELIAGTELRLKELEVI